MKILITGATGYVGNAIAGQFKKNGYDVTGLVRSKENAIRLDLADIKPLTGDLENIESFKDSLNSFDAVIHAGFVFNPGKGFEHTIKTEKIIVETIINSLSNTNKIFIYTSGTGVLGETGTLPVDESFVGNPVPFNAWRPAIEQLVIKAKGMKGIVIRPAMVYGNGGSPVLQAMINTAKTNKNTIHIGDGLNKWSVVHVADLAQLYVQAIEKSAGGEIYHGSSSEAISMRDLALFINELLSIKQLPQPVTLEEGLKYFPFGELLLTNIIASNDKARRLLKWKPLNESIANELKTEAYQKLAEPELIL